MKASAILFRFRMIILAAIICTGIWAPWVQFWNIGSRISLLEWLPLQLSRLGVLSFTGATAAVIVLGSLIAAIGALFRIWGSAWLGHGIVVGAQMQAGSLMADGPFRFVRNPLYLGLLFMIAALALLMPASGALFAMPAVTLFVFCLILGEETFLTAQIGEPYRAYLRAVPRLVPSIHSTLAPAGNKPQWLQAVLSEITPIGVLVTIAFLSWTYDNRLMLRAVLISFGISLVARAFLLGRRTKSIA